MTAVSNFLCCLLYCYAGFIPINLLFHFRISFEHCLTFSIFCIVCEVYIDQTLFIFFLNFLFCCGFCVAFKQYQASSYGKINGMISNWQYCVTIYLSVNFEIGSSMLSFQKHISGALGFVDGESRTLLTLQDNNIILKNNGDYHMT